MSSDPDELAAFAVTDPSLLDLELALSAVPGLSVGASFGDEHSWSIILELERQEDGRPTLGAWLSLEFLAWIARDYTRAEQDLTITASSLPPYLNHPGGMIQFWIGADRGGVHGIDPTKLAASVTDLFARYYITAEDQPAWLEEMRASYDDDQEGVDQGEEG